MTSSTSPRRRVRLVGACALASAVVAGVLTPLVLPTAATAAPLPAPPVVGPGTSGALKEVVLDWTGVASATSYVVQVGTDEQWADDPTLELTTVATRLTLPTSLPHASYVWRVAAVGEQGQGRWSPAGHFVRGWSARPTLVTPAGGPVDPADGVPTFRWTPVPHASEYQLQVSDSPYFDAPYRRQAGGTTESCFTTRTSVTPFNSQAQARNDGAGDCTFTLLGTGAPLHWRVRALDHVADSAPEVETTPAVDEGISSAPPARRDELDTSPCPDAPAPVTTGAPVGGGSTPSASPSPSASSSASPSSSPSSSSSPTASPSAGDEQERGSCEPAHTVEKGPWSASSSFSHVFGIPSPAPWFRDLPPAGRPVAAQGTCTAGRCADFPTLSWPRVAGAQWYRLTVALDAEYENIQAVVETPALTWTPVDSWRDRNAGSAYHVVVQAGTIEPARDGRPAGCDEPSEPLVFGKSSPRLAATSPADGAFVGGSEVVLSWQSASAALAAATGAPATSEARAYRVQVAAAANPGFAKDRLVEDVVLDSTHHVSATVRYPDGEYLWRVQPLDASGHRLPWSPVRRFVRDTTAPTFRVASADRLAPRGPVRVAFSEPVTGIDARSTSMSGVLASIGVAADRRTVDLRPGRVLVPGAGHTVTVTAGVRDRAGNPVAGKPVPVRVDPVVDDRSPALALAGPWTRLVASNAAQGTWTRSVPTGARRTSASVVLHGRGAEIKGCVGPAHGLLEVWADGVRAARVDTYRAWSGCGAVLARVTFGTPGTHRVELRGVGAKRPASKGTAVAVDAITAMR